MTLDEFFKKLSYTHLAELSISGEGSGQIVEAHQPKLITRANEGLVALYARFPLRIRTVEIETYASISEYYLRPEFALFSDSEETIKYIIDTEDVPFPNDVLMIESITDEDDYAVPLNDRNLAESWHLTGYDTLVIPSPADADRFRIRYRALPTEIQFGPQDLASVTVPIPRILEAALLAFVAGKIYGNMSMEGAMVKSQNFLDAYENECKIVEERNLLNSSINTTNLNPKLNGWP